MENVLRRGHPVRTVQLERVKLLTKLKALPTKMPKKKKPIKALARTETAY